METYKVDVLPSYLLPVRRKPTTLWKRWKQPLLFCVSCTIDRICRKPTTLWKRWKLGIYTSMNVTDSIVSETHYSLKEMETITCCRTYRRHCVERSETHYSLKEMETILHSLSLSSSLPSCRKPTTLWKRWKQNRTKLLPQNPFYHRRKPTTLWKRWKHKQYQQLHNYTLSVCRKPTTLWKRWKLCCEFRNIRSSHRKSETHYSLKEMETFLGAADSYYRSWWVGNPLLSERDGNLLLY